MKKLTITVAAAIAVFFMACNNLENTSNGADSIRLASDNEIQGSLDSAAAMKSWMEFKTPGNMHKMLAKSNGQWKEAITMWEKPSAPPQKAISSCSNTMILDGRYQQSVHKGNMMGMPFEGISTVGYDNIRKEFVMNWIDNMGTGFMQMAGPYDSLAQTIHFKGTMTDPTSRKITEVKEDFKFMPDGSQLLEMYASPIPNKPEFKTMEIRFTKR